MWIAGDIDLIYNKGEYKGFAPAENWSLLDACATKPMMTDGVVLSMINDR